MENKTEKIKLKRYLAFVFDFISIILFSFTIYGIIGLFIKLDSDRFQTIMLFVMAIIVLIYLFFGELFFKNTLGKYLLAIEVVNKRTLEKPTIINFVKRGLLKILWPIEGFVLLFSSSKQRLGDIWANTIVVNQESNRYKPAFRSMVGIGVIFVLYFSFTVSMGLAIKKTDYYKTGVNYLNTLNSLEIIGLPKVVNQNGNLVNFTVPIRDLDQNRYAEIFLEKTDAKWSVYHSDFIKGSIIMGFSYGFNPTASMKREYFANGKLKLEGAMINSKKEGTWKSYKEDGQIDELTIWHNDNQVLNKP